MNINLFGYKITICSTNPEKQAMDAINRSVDLADISIPAKIARIKALREPRVSKILIDAGRVPAEYVHDGGYVSLFFAKEWIDSHYN